MGVLRGVGPKIKERLSKFGIISIEDLLFHLPFRYQDRTKVTPIAALQHGTEALIEGTIKLSSIVFRGRRSLIIKLEDKTGIATIRFFNFSSSQSANLATGKILRCFGQVRHVAGSPELYHPEYRIFTTSGEPSESRLTPIYPSTEGMGQNKWRNLIEQALNFLNTHPPKDLLPDISAELNFDITAALIFLHAPSVKTSQRALMTGNHPAQERLALEELIAHNLSLRKVRAKFQEIKAPKIKGHSNKVASFLRSLPFKLTDAQTRSINEIISDLASDRPMLRLIQGDVGSGKTLVAAVAALLAIINKFQVAVMAPTEILVDQHARNFTNWLDPLGIQVSQLSGETKGTERKTMLDDLKENKANIVIGTHALFQKNVIFAKLGLVIIDEQHRFGVHQRLALTEKARPYQAHQLVMTATPIPRTLSMMAYADLDCSVIDEMPPGRQKIQTVLIDNRRRNKVISRVAAACRTQRQAYWVCTLIEESDALEAEAAEKTASSLRLALPDISIGLIHGRLKQNEKREIMSSFISGKINLLVSTTVIEVGVDVPNASLMIIENPERLGLAQLHQLRGRIGRGNTKSHCVLLYKQPLSIGSKHRLEVIRDSTDGFYIAEKDLEFRGPGEVLGTKQTGLMMFKIAQLPTHNLLLERVSEIAPKILNDTPHIISPLIDRWIRGGEEFGKV